MSLRSFLGSLSEVLGIGAGFSVLLVSDPAMVRYNARYRGKQGSTDVLSFPDEKEAWEAQEEQDGYLGDIVVSVETADRQKRQGLMEEIQSLCLHGLLHLMGYDHEADGGEMQALESRLRKEFGLV